jgi:plastocyanin
MPMFAPFAIRQLARICTTVALAGAAVLVAPAHAPLVHDAMAGDLHAHHGASAAVMSDAEMERWVHDFYAKHPIVRPTGVTGTPVVTFLGFGTKFDLDGDQVGTPTDTAHIMVGETVGWQRIVGTHTVTSGEGSADPNVAALFDAPLEAANPTFAFTYQSPGTFPFFCRVHEFFAMNGVVIVEAPVGVTPLPGNANALGFTNGPSPNPTLGTMSFRFALREAGRAAAQVFDTNGRRIADVIDRDLPAGSYGAAWDGRDRAGRHVTPGVYFLRLTLPGYHEARRVVISQ